MTLTLASIIDVADKDTAASLTHWAADAGTARDALLSAPADDLGALIREGSSWCEGCSIVLAEWTEQTKDDFGLTWCTPCGLTDQQVNPSSWREVIAEQAYDVFGGPDD